MTGEARAVAGLRRLREVVEQARKFVTGHVASLVPVRYPQA
jgi:hypothetical protein